MHKLEALIKRMRDRGLEVDVIEPSRPPTLRGIGELPIRFEGRGGKAIIAVPDATRPLNTGMILNFLAPKLLEKEFEVEVLFATGTHDMSRLEAKRMLGRWIDKVEYRIHDCKGEHAYVGSTRRGLAVEIDPGFAEAELRITVGVVAPHPWAGFSGGAKLILPGISSLRTIVEHHLRWFESGASGIVRGNVFREELDEAGRLAKVDYSLNLVLDEGGGVSYAAWGDIDSSFKDCVNIASKVYLKRVRGLYDVVVAFADPLDDSFYQSTKALEHASLALRKRGTLILVATCEKGVGSPEFKRYLSLDSGEIREEIASRRVGNLVPALVALTFKRICREYKVCLVTTQGLSGIDGIEVVDDLEEALSHAESGRGLVVIKGGFTVPMCSSPLNPR